LLAYAEQLLRLSSEAELALRSGKPRGKLRIGTLESTAAARLPPVLARYHRANPEVQIELVTGTTGALLEQVSRYAIEAAFVAERFESDDLEMMPVFRERLVVIAPKEITAIKKPGDLRGMTVPLGWAAPTGEFWRNGWLVQRSFHSVFWNLGLITRSSPASLRVLELLWYLTRSFTHYTRRAR
jgi:DNA-binding transcriptional LysR family regulator